MSSIKFSATATASAATSITIPLGGSPVVGDLVLVFLFVDNEIITRQPGYASEFTSSPNPWFKLEGLRATDTSTLSGWYHTWNAADSGSSVVFTFIPAPALGVGDKNIPNTNAVAVAVVLNGASSTALLEHNIYGLAQNLDVVISTSPMKKAANLNFVCAASNNSLGTWNDNDPASTLVQQVMLSAGDGLTVAVWSVPNTPVGYVANLSLDEFDGFRSLLTESVSVSDNLPQRYNPPYIEEGPMANNTLMFRYRINRFFTVLNNAGTFVARRYLSTDEVAAATQVFANNQPITSTDRTNILASGVGGDFQAVT